MVLETFRKGGEGVATVVWFVKGGGRIYFRTPSNTGKVKRIARNASVRLAPSSFRGKVLGSWTRGEAVVLEPSASGAIDSLFGEKYGLQKRLTDLFSKFRGTGYVVYEIRRPESEESGQVGSSSFSAVVDSRRRSVP